MMYPWCPFSQQYSRQIPTPRRFTAFIVSGVGALVIVVPSASTETTFFPVATLTQVVWM